ncbi:hypothetical protein Acsp04_09090 [Actinomadura sp. NBRC 104425]|uniref:suppressor of fused domain protein n=1 Tax=Actinomadura sp. NBRC 104425 TaxID=3032204 RepID=UPI0024A39E8D|nr:suppressor of fused domain protein [Actinomadura sp. NBRC 104425]GLZ10674.1 hypothetical protein Acsp04_09090 [Actinomadura sp. NBRC 104425]
MSYPYTDPDRYEGLLAHMQRHLGRVVSAQGPVMGDGRNRGFAIGFHAHPEMAMVSAASTGVRFQKVTATLPEEFVVSALPGQEDEAGYLLHVAAERVIGSGRGYEFGGGYVNSEPLIPGSRIEFLLAAGHPCTGDGFNVFHDRQGRPALQVITLIPATRAEFELVREHGGDSGKLLEVWRSRNTDLLDVYRESAV